MKLFNKQKNTQSGYILVLALIVLTLVLINSLVLISRALNFSQSSKYSLESVQAINLAEAGIDKAVATLNKTAGSYTGETDVSLGDGTYTIKVIPVDSTTSIVESTGYVPNSTNPKSKRTISIKVAKGDGLSFNYGILAGQGGFSISGGSRVNGSVFSNGDINMSGGGIITGNASVAGGTQPTSDQNTDCVSPNCTDFIFGRNVSGNNQLDVAQSFRPNTASAQVINQVKLKLKKFGTNHQPVTVRILGDNNNKPDKNVTKASGLLQPNLVTSQYSFVDVSFSTTNTLTPGTRYWIVLDTNSDATNYWAWSLDSLGSYNNGSPAWSANWQQNPNPTWTNFSGDLGFQTFMGGQITSITGIGSSSIQGSAHANTLSGNNPSALVIGQDAYYQTQSGITVHGANCTNNSYCHPNSTDPQPVDMPISQGNIDEWQEQASQAPPYNGNLTIQWPCTPSLEKRKYNGNVTVQGGCTIQIDSPVWITGNFTVTGGSTVKLKSSYGETSGMIIVDGKVDLGGGSRLQGSGNPLSYLTVLSKYASPGGDSDPAIVLNGGNSSSIAYAANGVISLTGGTHIREATAKRIVMTSGATLTYETGVANPFFTSGPSGAYAAIKGSYQIK